MYFNYLQLLVMLPFADDRAKSIWNYTSLCCRFRAAAQRGHTHRKRWKAYTNDLVHLLLFIIVNLQEGEEGRAFSRDFTTKGYVH